MSVNSSVYDFVEWNGRTYHKYKEGSKRLPLNNLPSMNSSNLHAEYVFPNDAVSSLPYLLAVPGATRLTALHRVGGAR